MLKALKINNGSVLVDGVITWPWANILFWRSFICLVCHYMAILITMSLALKLGIITQQSVETQIKDIVNRPSEDTATMFSFVKQSFYHKTLAYTNYEKNKDKKRTKCF